MLKVKKLFNFIIFILLILVIAFILYKTSEYNDIKNWSDKTKMTPVINDIFLHNEYSYNHKLAQKSLELAVSAFSNEDSLKMWGENTYCGREVDVKDLLVSHGFSDIKFFDYNISLNDYSSKAAFAIGKTEYDKTCDLVAIVIRGGRYGLEWADNFNIGTSDINYHKGFYNAAYKIKKQLEILLPDYSPKNRIKFWITGYSRGGAIANILASMYDDSKNNYPCQVYAYTFASPKTAIIKNTHCHDTIYRNIFNILSPNDPVYNIPPSKWDFGRFGICVVFPDNNRNKNNDDEKILDLVYEDYRQKTGKTPITQGTSVNSIVNLIVKSSDSRNFFAKNLSEPIGNLIIVKMTRTKTEYGYWEKSSEEKTLKKMFGEEIINDINKIKNNYLFNSLKKIGIKLPDDFYIFISLCRANGFTGYENLIFEKLDLNELSNLSQIASSDFIYVGHTTDFYFSWLKNVPITKLEFIKD